jgi:hypothetical protein
MARFLGFRSALVFSRPFFYSCACSRSEVGTNEVKSSTPILGRRSPLP